MIHFFKALADETRLQVVGILSIGEFSVQEITRILDMGQSRISRHLKILSDAGIAVYRRDGARVFYRLSTETLGIPGQILSETVKWLKDQVDWKPLKTSVEEILEWRRSQSRSFFSESAREWPVILDRFVEQKVFVNALRSSLSSVKKLADLGCGPGHVIRKLHPDIPEFIGVDYSVKMLEFAKSNLKDLVADGSVNLRLGAMEHLPLGDSEVEGILITLVLHHLAEPDSIFSEFRRVLKPDGLVTIVDFKKHEREEFRDEMADLWLGFDPEDLSKWLKKAGLRDISVKDFPGGKGNIQLIIAQGRK
ncbi:metalloregulator ArsR/SmtB family transcription factor [bacterium]|nr:metalloregulator ArsR/SmtB family transcription factor [bacterium]